MPLQSENVPKNRTALIAGCGYVGHRVARAWVENGIRTYAISRDAAKARRLVAEGIHPIVMDLSAPETWPELPQVDVVLWCVGFDRSGSADRTKLWIDGLRTLLNRCQFRTNPGQLIYTSSTGVYGDSGGGDVDEETTPCPDSEGGKACLAAEEIVREFSLLSGHTATVLRLAGIYGPDRLLRRISDLRSQIPITSPPDDWLNLVHVDDIVRVIDSIAMNPSAPKTPLMNVVAAGSVTRRTYYSTLAELASAPSPIFQSSSSTGANVERSGRGSGNRRIISYARRHLGVHFRFDKIDEGLRDAIERSAITPS